MKIKVTAKDSACCRSPPRYSPRNPSPVPFNPFTLYLYRLCSFVLIYLVLAIFLLGPPCPREKKIPCQEPAISLHFHHVSPVQWTTHLLPTSRDLGSNPQGVLMWNRDSPVKVDSLHPKNHMCIYVCALWNKSRKILTQVSAFRRKTSVQYISATNPTYFRAVQSILKTKI